MIVFMWALTFFGGCLMGWGLRAVYDIKASKYLADRSKMMSEQTANLCTTDACEALRARLASQGGEDVSLELVENLKYGGMHIRKWENLAGLGAGTHKLYTHPADQVAEPDAELVELLRSKFPRIDPCQPVPVDEKAHCCEYTIYVERERLHRIIDAKLASLK
jgi:hypothetical protein